MPPDPLEQPGVLRTRLRECGPALHEELERCWRKADEWLHAIGVNRGSYNSYPHLRNVERHLDHLVTSFEALPRPAPDPPLSPVELYLLLTAILFHDIGRTQRKTIGGTHGGASGELLRKRYAHLGISSPELARSLAKIAEFHNTDPGKTRAQWLQELGCTVIEPHGEVREALLACLVCLADCMDAGFTRTVPDYIEDHLGPIGLFRRKIRGVYADPAAAMIRTVLAHQEEPATRKPRDGDGCIPIKAPDSLGEPKETGEPQKTLIDSFIKNLNKCYSLGQYKGWAVMKMEVYKAQQGSRRPPKALARLGDFSATLRVLIGRPPSAGKLPRHHPSSQLAAAAKGDRGEFAGHLLSRAYAKAPPISTLDVLLALGLLHVDAPEGVASPPDRLVTALTLGNHRENVQVLGELRPTLAEAGFRIDRWLIEYDEALYNNLGFETYEPILDPVYLMAVIDGMWTLTNRIFDTAQFSYEDLAAQVGEVDVGRVRRAVRRIAVATRQGGRARIAAGARSWNWLYGAPDGGSGSLTKDEAETAVKGLSAPFEPYDLV